MVGDTIKDIFRRYIHYSPEVLTDVSKQGSISENTMRVIAGSNLATSPDPYRKSSARRLLSRSIQLGIVPPPASMSNPLTNVLLGVGEDEGYTEITRRRLPEALNENATQVAQYYLPNFDRSRERPTREMPEGSDPVFPNRRMASAPEPPPKPNLQVGGRPMSAVGSVHGPKLQHR